MGSGPLRSLGDRWVDDGHYSHLFQRLRTSPGDPESLLVAALLHSDGTVELRQWFVLPNGTTTESSPGNYTIRVLDAVGQILAEVSLPIDFMMYVEPLGVQPTDTVPLVVILPYPETAGMVEIVREGQVLTSISSPTKLLHDVMDAIPDFGFIRNPSQQRNALHAKVAAIENMINAGATRGALEKLVHDLMIRIQFWLVDGYVKVEPIQMEKQEVLTVIEGMIERIGNLGN